MARRRPAEPAANPARGAALVVVAVLIGLVLLRNGLDTSEAITTTVLQDVKVMSIGRYTQPGQAPATDSRGNQTKQTVATLLVTPDEAQKL